MNRHGLTRCSCMLLGIVPLLAGCASTIVRAGPTFDFGTIATSGVTSGAGGHAEFVSYDAADGGGYGVGAALELGGYQTSGDADPIAFTTLETRYRLPIGSNAKRTQVYWEVGTGAGVAWTPALQSAVIPLQVELGAQRSIGSAFLVAGVRERFLGLIGSGSPMFDAFNSVQLVFGIGIGSQRRQP